MFLPFDHLGARSNRSDLVFVVGCSVVGLAAFVYPLVLPIGREGVSTGNARFLEPAILLGIILLVSMAAILGWASTRLASSFSVSRGTSILAALIAVNALFRLLPSIGGASAMFLLIILAGTSFGAPAGFLTGALSLLLSAIITGGLGPWLPYQMLGAGWVGLIAGLLPAPREPDRRYWFLIGYGAVAGFAYGVLLSLYDWPFLAPGISTGDATMYWTPDAGFMETVHRYAVFYVTTSAGHDLARALGNMVLLALFALPILRLLDRAAVRTSWKQLEPTVVAADSGSTSNIQLF